ncbi:adenomatous polyposis coli protein [Eurytemora carolleeae]|uniref:adenomatous polyposis coli protein n=1 Tax=Eurytemora carolleeae TaxID=1294199 RepID=UPI000C759910|nr:adenomatous polyposis coli protein [Eurytemora carolleeae]|eukprot:XP_023332204.1 adenomatous polyposis coli protein-like [Eurytemora affinis]
MAGNSPNYDALLDQIQTLSDMQKNGNLHAADPVKQAAYMKRLQQQAESIKKMLKLLNNSRAAEFSTSNSNRASNSDFTRKSGDFNAVNFGEIRQINEGGGWRGEDNEHYEQLWELSTTVNEYDVPEVGVDEDILDEEEEGLVEGSVDNWEDNLYENTSITAAHLTLSVEVPPPLPPRLPSRSNLNHATDNSNALTHFDRNSQSGLSDRNSQSIHSDRNSQPSQRSATQSESSKSSKPNLSSNKCNDVNFDKFSVGGLNCSTPHPALPSLSNRSCVTSTPKEFGGGQTIKGPSGNSRSKTELLQKKREELIASLQAEEQERQWYYTQLELIAQKIRNIPLSSLHSYSLENEAARQELEDRAARVQASMQRQLGDAEQVSRDRRHKVQQVKILLV